MAKLISSARRNTLRAWALEHRRHPTVSEARLWACLRGAQLGVTFRRQCVVGESIVDLLASSAKVVVEVDGAWHERRAKPDARRVRELERKGYRVIRVTAEQVMRELPVVLERIRQALRE